MNKGFRYALYTGLSALLLASAGAPTFSNNNVSAKRIHSERNVKRFTHEHNVHKYNRKRIRHIRNVHKYNLSRRKRKYDRVPNVFEGHWHDNNGGKFYFDGGSIQIWQNHHGYYDAAFNKATSYGNMYYLNEYMDYNNSQVYHKKSTWKIRLINKHKIYVYKQDGEHTSTGTYYKSSNQ